MGKLEEMCAMCVCGRYKGTMGALAWGEDAMCPPGAFQFAKTNSTCRSCPEFIDIIHPKVHLICACKR